MRSGQVRRLRTVVVVSALLLAGCADGVEGTAAGKPGLGDRLTAADSLGDFRTVDPCSLTAPATFDEHGTFQPPATTTMDECVVDLDVEGELVTASIGELEHLETLPSGNDVRRLPGEVTVVEIPVSLSGACRMGLVFADDIVASVEVVPDQLDAVDRDIICDIAQAGVDGVFDAVSSDSVRHWEPPHDSLARESACGLLSSDQVGRQLGITGDRITLYPAEHQCRWGRTGGDTATVKLDFPIGKNPRDVGADEDQDEKVTIAGRRSWVTEIGTGELGVCMVTTEHIEFALGADGDREYAVLRVAVPANAGRDACEIGRTLARSAWGKLPAAP